MALAISFLLLPVVFGVALLGLVDFFFLVMLDRLAFFTCLPLRFSAGPVIAKLVFGFEELKLCTTERGKNGAKCDSNSHRLVNKLIL